MQQFHGQLEMRPVRININNKELWEKEARLYRRWYKISWWLIILTLLCYIGIWPFCAYREQLVSIVNVNLFGMNILGLIYLFVMFTLIFLDLLALIKLETHKSNWYNYKFKKSINKKDYEENV